MKTLPPVAWKKLPCGSESATVAPAWTVAAAAKGETPAAHSAPENVCEAIVAPAVVEAVAAAIKTPETGARAAIGNFSVSSSEIMSAVSPEAFTMPATVPVQ